MLTGRFNFRRTLTGKIVLQVEEHGSSFWSLKGDLKKRWRNATVLDLASRELRNMMDLRTKLQTQVEVSAAQLVPGSAQNVVPLKKQG